MPKPELKKRERAVNFAPSEIRSLMDIVYDYKHIVENKKTDAVTNQEKEAAWNQISLKFNATSSGVMRTSKTLKLKYEGIKKNTKVKAAINRQETYKTGGGPITQIPFTDVETKVLNICSNIDGLESQNDSDTFKATNLESINNNSALETECDTIMVLEPTITIDTDPTGTYYVDVDSSENIEPTGPLADVDGSKKPESRPMTDNDAEKKGTKYELDTKWKKWTPQALKKKVNPLLQTKVTKAGVTAKFDQLTTARLELIELQKQVVLNELNYKKIEHELHVQHKTEEHELKMLHLHNEEKRREVGYKRPLP